MKKIRSSVILSLIFSLTPVALSASQGILKTILGLTLLFTQKTTAYWTHEYATELASSTSKLNYDVTPVDDDQSVAVGSYKKGSFIAELDGNGNKKWAKYFDEEKFSNVLKNKEGKYYTVGTRVQEGSYNNIPATLVVKFDIENDKEDPFSASWSKEHVSGFYSEVNDITELDGSGIAGVGPLYGGFDVDTAFSFDPRAFVFSYDKFGNNYASLSFSIIGLSEIPYSIQNSGNNTLSIVGWTSYNTGISDGAGGTYKIPATFISKITTTGGSLTLNSTQILVCPDSLTPAIPSITQGMAGYNHITTAEGNQVIIGVVTTFASSSSNQDNNQLFAVEVDKNGNALWTRRVANYNLQSFGFGVAEGIDGNYFFIGSVIIEGKKKSLYLKATKGTGELIYSRTDSGTTGYEYTAGFSVNVTENGNIFVPGGIVENTAAQDDINFLLRKFNNNLENCGEAIDINFEAEEFLLSRTMSANEQTVYAPATVHQSASFVSNTDITTFDKSTICYEVAQEEKKKLKDGQIAAITIASVVFVCCLGAITAYKCKP